VLIVDDESRITSFVARALTAEGLAVDSAHNGIRALELARTGIYDLVILDLLLPGLDGVSVLRSIVDARPGQPILVLSALSDVGMKVRCLELGASDFLPKPFELAELVARVRARLRSEPRRDGQSVAAGRLRLDVLRRTADVGAGPVALSERELALLLHLMRNEGRTCTRAELLAAVWGYTFDPGTNIVDVYVRRLRAKLSPTLIETVRHVGYRIVPP
jgi:DNA-binding response OmpR family regulator